VPVPTGAVPPVRHGERPASHVKGHADHGAGWSLRRTGHLPSAQLKALAWASIALPLVSGFGAVADPERGPGVDPLALPHRAPHMGEVTIVAAAVVPRESCWDAGECQPRLHRRHAGERFVVPR